MPDIKKMTCAIAATAAVLLSTVTADAVPGVGSGAYTIRADRGGKVIAYALRMKKMKRAGRSVRFAGRCSSACTLYMALPRSSTCISPGASFGFHLPFGASAKGNEIVRDYLVRSYPGWVRNWIVQNGGLTKNIKNMDYAYAAKYLPTCDTSRFNARHKRDFRVASRSGAP